MEKPNDTAKTEQTRPERRAMDTPHLVWWSIEFYAERNCTILAVSQLASSGQLHVYQRACRQVPNDRGA